MELLVAGQAQNVVIAPTVEAEEIAQNVRLIITTPKGSVPLDRDFGLDFDVLDRPSPRAQVLMEVEIVRQVGRYEPRARVVSVTWEQALTEAMEGQLIPVVRIEIKGGTA